MIDFRCKQCNRLLAKVEGAARVEIKCPRCKALNAFSEQVYITIEEELLEEKKCTDQDTVES